MTAYFICQGENYKKRQEQMLGGLSPLSNFLTELNIPVGNVKKMLAAIMHIGTKPDKNKRLPYRFTGLPDKPHTSLAQEPAAFASITGETGAHNIIPGGFPATCQRYNMVKIQILRVKLLSAELTCEFDFVVHIRYCSNSSSYRQSLQSPWR